MKGYLLNELKELLKDESVHFEVARVQRLGFAKDRSVLRVACLVVPDNYEVIARVTWDGVGDGNGIFHPINPNDLVLIAFASGSEDNAFVIRRLTDKEDILPEMLVEGHTVVRSVPGKKLYMGGDKTLVQKVGSLTDPTENVVLGQVLKQLLSDILAELALLSQNIIEHTHIGNLGFETTTPINDSDFSDNKVVFESKKASPVDDELILSDIFFTEKGN